MDDKLNRVAIDLMVLIDLEGTLTEFRELWYGDREKEAQTLSLADCGAVLWSAVRPRPGALGSLRDMRREGGRVQVFTDITDPEVGERAQDWLRLWSNEPTLLLHSIRAGQSPIILDQQAYLLAEGHSFVMPEGRPRVYAHPAGGPFDHALLEKARKL